jgi:hypothetical protein
MVTITSSVAIVNDDTIWSTISGHGDQDAWSCTGTAGRVPPVERRRPTPAPHSASTAGAGASRPRRTSTATSRSSRALPHPGPPPWCGGGTPIRSASCAHGRGACAHGECATRHAPLDRHRRGHLPDGVASHGLFSEKLPRDRLQGVHPDLIWWSSARSCSRLRTSGSGSPRVEQRRRPRQRSDRRVPHLAHPAFRRLDWDHLEQLERPRSVCSGRGRGAGRRGRRPAAVAGAGLVACLMG